MPLGDSELMFLVAAMIQEVSDHGYFLISRALEVQEYGILGVVQVERVSLVTVLIDLLEVFLQDILLPEAGSVMPYGT